MSTHPTMLTRLFLSLLILAPTALFAAETPTITISKSDTIAIAVSPLSGPDGAAATKILQRDLALSGYFNIAPPSSAAFVVGGVSSGGSLQGKVTDHGGQTALARTYNGSDRNKVHQFADDIIETLTGNRGMANSKIAFVATRSGRKEIYTADFDGSNVQQLTRDNSISVGPKLSPDGRKLAYTGYKSGYADVYSIELGSGARGRILKFPGHEFRRGFFAGRRTDRGHVEQGRQSRALRHERRGRRRAASHPHLRVSSPRRRGRRAATRSSIPTTSTAARSFIASPPAAAPGARSRRAAATAPNPTGRPTAKKIAFNVREGGSFQIAVLDLASGQTRTLAPGERPAWGPDSRHILYSGGGGLYLLDVQTGRKVKVLDGLGKISEPTWSR